MVPLKWTGAVAAVVICYVIYPYYSLYQLQNAVQSGDIKAIEDRIDWPRLREGLKGDLAAAMSADLDKKAQKDEPGEKMATNIARVFSGPLISSMVDTNVTPAALAQMTKGQQGKGT